MRTLILPIAIVLSLVGPLSLRAESFVCASTDHFPQVDLSLSGAAKLTPPHLPSAGSINVLVIFAQFYDETPGPPRVPNYAPQILDPTLPGSFAHFYHTMSGGQLQIRGTVLPKRYMADQPATAYLASRSNEFGNYGQFVHEILRQVDSEIDFGLYDNDGPDGVPNSGDDDGVVDYIFINLLSTPRNLILGAATGVVGLGLNEYISSDASAKGYGIRIIGSKKHGALQREGKRLAQAVGSMAHEFGHSLGLPDLYDTSFQGVLGEEPTEDSAGIGYWGLMGWGAQGWNGNDGPNAFCAWSLEELGWIGRDNDRLIEIQQDVQGLHITDMYQEGHVYKIWLSPIPLTAYESGRLGYIIQKPYLLLEYRSRSAHYYNRNLPAEGLLIWEVHPFAQNNTREERKRVDLICADGLYADAGYPQGRIPDAVAGKDNLDFWAHDERYTSAHEGNMGDATDVFDGVRYRRLTVASNPATRTVSPASTGVAIERMRRQANGMAMDITMPRWSSTIGELVHWQGDIHVTGDINLAPEGTLILVEGTNVHLGAQDRLQTGRDIARNEIHLQGQFEVFPVQNYAENAVYLWRNYKQPIDPVVFQAAEPGTGWYGLVVDPAPSINLKLPENSLVLRDATHGLVLARAPVGIQGLEIKGYTVLQGEATAEGEQALTRPPFQIAIDLADWSLTAYEGVQAQLQWDTPLVSPPQRPLERNITSAPFSLYPGQEVPLHFPPLALNGSQSGAQQVNFTMRLWKGTNPLWEENLVVVVPDERATVDDDVATAVLAESQSSPTGFALLPNYPNPFNPYTTLPYRVPQSQDAKPMTVRLEIYSINGQRVRTLLDGVQTAGLFQVQWDGRDEQGKEMASGVYIAFLHIGHQAAVQRLVLVK